MVKRLASDESGFSLVELLTASMIGVIILFAGFTVMDLAGKSTRKTSDRVDAVANGRIVMDRITTQLRSQICPGIVGADGVEVPAVEVAETDRVVWYGSLAAAPTQSGKVELQRRELQFVPTSGSRGNIVEKVWRENTPAGQSKPTFPSTTATPTSTRTLATDVARASAGAPLFKYFKYDDAQSPQTLQLTAPVTDRVQRALIVRIDVAFDTYPTGVTDAKLRTVFQDSAFVRTADPTDPLHSPRCL